MECLEANDKSAEHRDGERLLGQIRGKHGTITIVTPDRDPAPDDLKELYKIMIEISVNIARREATLKK